MERRNIFGLLYICSSIFSLIATQNTTAFNNSSNITTASLNNGNITTASPNNGNITTASPNNGNITTASPNNGNITTASPNNGNITTASPNNGNITTASPNNGNLTTASPNNSSITTASPNNSSITTASPNNTNITTASPNNSSITTASPNNTNITTASPKNSSITTASTISTTTSTPPVTKFNIIFSISETFIAVYSNLNDPETIKLKDRITNEFFKVYKTRFPNFVRMVILQFRSGSIVTDSVLEFDNNGTRPNVSEVTNTLVQAAKNGSFNFTVDTNSINITELAVTQNVTSTTTFSSNITTASNNISNITTASPNNSSITNASPNNTNITTASPNNTNITTASTNNTNITTASPISTTSAPVTKFNLSFSISETFIAVYSNLNDPETIKLKDRITTGFFKVYKTRFQNFVRMVILRFRSGSIVTDSVLEFDNNGTIPNVSEVTKTLVQAATNGSFNFTVDTNSINITELAVTQNVTSTTTFSSNITTASNNISNITTASPNNTNITSASNNISNITTASPNNTNITTASTNNTNITSAPTISTTTAPVTKFNLSFSISETFIAVYSNLNDPETIKLRDRITTGFFKVYKTRFQNFVRMVILLFRSGSIVTDGVLEFDNNGTIPNVTLVARTLVQAVKDGNFTFTIDVNSIKVTDSSGNTSSRSPVLASMLTALWMTLTSLLLSAVMHL